MREIQTNTQNERTLAAENACRLFRPRQIRSAPNVKTQTRIDCVVANGQRNERSRALAIFGCRVICVLLISCFSVLDMGETCPQLCARDEAKQ